MFKYVVAALAAGAEAQSRFRGRRRRNRRFSTDPTLYTGPPAIAAGATEYARAVYVPRKAYGTFAAPANKNAVKENEGVRGIIIAESIDTTALTPDTTASVYAYFSNLGNDVITSYTLGISQVADLKLWKCQWNQILEIQTAQALTAVPVVASTDASYPTRSGVVGRQASHAAGYTTITDLTDLDIKTNAADSAAGAGQGRRTFRGTGWRKTGALSNAASDLISGGVSVKAGNVNYVIELRGVDAAASDASAAATAIERIGCGVFRPYNEESAKKRVEDIFLPLTAYAAASATNTSGILEEMQNNQKVQTAAGTTIGKQIYTPGTDAAAQGLNYDGVTATPTTIDTIV